MCETCKTENAGEKEVRTALKSVYDLCKTLGKDRVALHYNYGEGEAWKINRLWVGHPAVNKHFDSFDDFFIWVDKRKAARAKKELLFRNFRAA